MKHPDESLAPRGEREFTDPQRVAERVRDHMWAGDRASRGLGMVVDTIGPGSCTMSMTVREDMINGHGTCQGGLVTALADSAFAFACNAHNEITVASGFSVDLVAPSRLGDRLTARAVEVSKAGRTGVYDVEVRNQRGERVCLFRGRSHTMRGKPVVALECPQDRALPGPPPEGVKETWGGPAFPCE